jgi:putative transferase (TIGR04331 family)
MNDIRTLIIAAQLPEDETRYLLDALARQDTTSLMPKLSHLASMGQDKLAISICKHLVATKSVDPSIFATLGAIFHQRGEPEKAGFYFFCAFLLGCDLSAATPILEIFKELDLSVPGCVFARSLGDVNSQIIKDLRLDFERENLSETSRAQEKSLFVVSHYNRAQRNGGTKIYLADTFLAHLRRRDACDPDLSLVDVAPSIRKDKDDLLQAATVVAQAHEKILSILGERLNAIHNLRMSPGFWRKAFGMALYRHITLLYDFFTICEQNFDPLRHTCEILNPRNYHIPLDYLEHRWLLQHQHFGQEQLLSLYLRTFYPDISPTYETNYRSEYKISPVAQFVPSQPTVGIMCAYFAPHYAQALVQMSRGEINHIGFNRNFPIDGNELNREARAFLSTIPSGANRFERFFFGTLFELMPKVFVESFIPVLSSIDTQLKAYNRLEYVVSEMWLSETYEAFALALLGERGIKHIYNEHNYLEHPYYASQFTLQASVPDIFLSHGNYDGRIPNQVKAGSLFEFIPPDLPQRATDTILYVSSIATAKYCHYSHAYMETAEHGEYYYNFKRRFFEAISPELRSAMLYRGYPRDEWSGMWQLNWDDSFIMGDLLDGIRMDDHSQSAKSRMAESKLVIVDYISTSILESLSINVPTVLLLRPESAILNEHYADLFAELTRVGICQEDPVKAALFIEKVRHKPSDWWWTEEVQTARARFLKKNLGKPEDALRFYLGLTQKQAKAI